LIADADFDFGETPFRSQAVRARRQFVGGHRAEVRFHRCSNCRTWSDRDALIADLNGWTRLNYRDTLAAVPDKGSVGPVSRERLQSLPLTLDPAVLASGEPQPSGT
jgi:hypothetical protein